MVKTWLLSVILFGVTVPASASEVTAFLVKEYTSGVNKICVYNLLGDEYIVTIKNTELCKLTIKVKR